MEKASQYYEQSESIKQNKNKNKNNLRTILLKKKKKEQNEIENFFLITIWEERAIVLIKNQYV